MSDWDLFDPTRYLVENYRNLYSEDAHTLRFLVDTWRSIGNVDRYVELGTGPNVYPALAALPYAGQIDLQDPNQEACQYLNVQRDELDEPWLELHWSALQQTGLPYAGLNPQNLFRRVVTVTQADFRDMPVDYASVGGMFFVAECLTGRIEEFAAACQKLVRAVRAGGTVLAGFVEGSDIFDRYPTVSVTPDVVRDAFSSEVTDVCVTRVGRGAVPFRAGYTGLILARAQRR